MAKFYFLIVSFVFIAVVSFIPVSVAGEYEKVVSAQCEYCDNYLHKGCIPRNVNVYMNAKDESFRIETLDSKSGKIIGLDKASKVDSKCSFKNYKNWRCQKKINDKVGGTIMFLMSQGKYSHSFVIYGRGQTLKAALNCKK
jgi:hypothetical protein